MDIVLAKKLLEVHEHEADLAPALDVRAPETHELWSLVYKFALSEQKLMQRILVHEFVVATAVGVLVLLKLLLATRQRQLIGLGHWNSELEIRLRKWLDLVASFDQSFRGWNQGSAFWNRFEFNVFDNWLQVKFDVIFVEFLNENFAPDVFFTLIMESSPFKLNRRCTLLKSRCQIDILGNDTSIKQREHALVDIFLADRRRVGHFFLFFNELPQLPVPLIPLLYYSV